MATPLIRKLALRLSPRLDSATLEKPDLEVMSAALRADAATAARLDELDMSKALDETYVRHRFAYELAFAVPGASKLADTLDALDGVERELVLATTPAPRADGREVRFGEREPLL